jgi:hypothetical protein
VAVFAGKDVHDQPQRVHLLKVVLHPVLDLIAPQPFVA